MCRSGFFVMEALNLCFKLLLSMSLTPHIQPQKRFNHFKPAHGQQKGNGNLKPLPIGDRMNADQFHSQQKDAQKDKNHAIPHDKQADCLPK